MTFASLVLVVLRVSIALNVAALGLGAGVSDATALLRRPALALKSLAAMNLAMPFAAILLATTFDLHPAVKVALVALSISPVPPVLPRKALKLGGHEPYVVGLLVITAAVSVVSIPAVLELIQPIFGIPLDISLVSILRLVLRTVLGPLAIGMTVRHFFPALAGRVVKPVALFAMILLVGSGACIVFAARAGLVALIGNGTLAAIATFIIIGLIVGYAFAGPDRDDRTVLALAASSRHPGIALAIAHANFPEQKLATAAIGLYLLVNLLIGLPLSRWAKHVERGA